MAYIGNMHAEGICPVQVLRDGNGIVKVLGVLAVDCYHQLFAKVKPSFGFRFRNLHGNTLCLRKNLLRKLGRNSESADRRHYVNAGRIGSSQNLGYHSFRILVRVSEVSKLTYDLLSADGALRMLLRDIYVEIELCVIRTDKSESLRLTEGPDNRLICPRENARYDSFRTVLPAICLVGLAGDGHHNRIAVHRI